MLDAVDATIADDFCFPARQLPEPERVFVPCREGRSLYSIVKRRSFRKRQSAGRCAGVNGGKNVLFSDD